MSTSDETAGISSTIIDSPLAPFIVVGRSRTNLVFSSSTFYSLFLRLINSSNTTLHYNARVSGFDRTHKLESQCQCATSRNEVLIRVAMQPIDSYCSSTDSAGNEVNG